MSGEAEQFDLCTFDGATFDLVSRIGPIATGKPREHGIDRVEQVDGYVAVWGPDAVPLLVDVRTGKLGAHGSLSVALRRPRDERGPRDHGFYVETMGHNGESLVLRLEQATGRVQWKQRVSWAYYVAASATRVFVAPIPFLGGTIHVLDGETGEVLGVLGSARRGFQTTPLGAP